MKCQIRSQPNLDSDQFCRALHWTFYTLLLQQQQQKCIQTLKVSLFQILGFVLDEKFQQNASKFSILYIYENPKLLFPLFISCYFKSFFPNECPGRKKQLWVFIYIRYGKFWCVSLQLYIKHKLWNWEEWYSR